MRKRRRLLPSPPVLRGRGVGGEGVHSRVNHGVTPDLVSSTPHPQPLSPEYRGEGSSAVVLGRSSQVSRYSIVVRGAIQGNTGRLGTKRRECVTRARFSYSDLIDP